MKDSALPAWKHGDATTWRLLAARCSKALSTLAVVCACAVPGEARSESGFKEIVSDGFGDRYNLCAWSQAVFNDRLYVGTFNQVNGGQIWRYDGHGWQMVLSRPLPNKGFRVMLAFEGSLYAGALNEVAGAELWRSADGAAWQPVVSGGFGNADNTSVNTLEVFRQHLYAGLQNQSGSGGQLWRSDTGLDWNPVTQNGFGNPDNHSVHAMTSYQLQLYVGTKNPFGLQMLRSSDGVTFEMVVGPGAFMSAGFGIPGNANTQHLHVHKGILYIGTGNELAGFSVLRTADGIQYQPVLTGGMGDPDNLFAWRFFSFAGTLWMGTGNFNIPGNEGGSALRSTGGMHWEPMVGANGQYFGYGFDDWRNWGIQSFAEYRGHLYIGTEQTWRPEFDQWVTGLQIWRWSGVGGRGNGKDPIISESAGVPGRSGAVTLAQNFPNPFNPQTTIAYTVNSRANVAIEIFDATGALVTRLDEGVRDAGSYRVVWSGRDAWDRAVASGIYLYRLAGTEGAVTHKMVMLK
jgi:hypothetical protein